MKRADKIENKRIFKSTTTALSEVRQFVEDNALSFGFGEKEVSEITLAVDEACTNVIKHAYQSDPNFEFEVRITAGGIEFQVVVRDWGAGFKPEEVPVPNIKGKIGRHKAGGLGIFLMRKLMDSVEFQGRETMNEVRLVRYLKNEPKP
ncbi:MAG: ATP-binding protein [Bacteroidetes bacterium]|nr:ATP-binding protein [Bacteroidota bacterium]MCL5033877.1 ATP-binding protein [Bacteroidota bacterium]